MTPGIVPRKIDVDGVRAAIRRPDPRAALHRRVAAGTTKLHPPADSESGVAQPPGDVSDLPPVHLAVVGESSALGVGCERADQTLAAQVGALLAAREGRAVAWRTVAADGATADYVTTHLLDRLTRTPLDVVVVAVGVNDLVRGHRPAKLGRHVAALVNRTLGLAPGAQVVLSGLPDPARMPLLPRPVAIPASRLARAYDRALEDAARRRHLAFVPVRHLTLTAADLAEDGFHPGPTACRTWAGELVRAVRPLPVAHQED